MELRDYVRIFHPSWTLIVDAAGLSKLTGGALLTVASGRVKRNEFAAAVRALERVGGVVATMLPTKGSDSYSYGQYSYGTIHGDQLEADTEEIMDRRSVRGVRRRSTS